MDEAPQKIVCMSSSHIAFLRELGLEHKIVYYAGHSETVDYEAIAALGADLALLSMPDDGRMERLGVRTLVVEEWLETTPLARAGWIVAIARACGVPEKGAARYKAIEAAYNAQKARVETGGARPKVMLNAPYRDVWFVPGDDNYMVRLIEDAGGEWLLRGLNPGPQSRPIDLEQAWLAMKKADFWLNPNHYSSVGELLKDNPRMAEMPPVVNARTYNNNARATADGGSDFWESGVVRPDAVLRDLIAILHSRPDSLYYYRQLR